METIKVDVKTEIIEKSIILETFAKYLKIKEYWQSNNDLRSDWGIKEFNNVNIKIIKIVKEYDFEYTGKSIFESWYLYINGEKVADDITRIKNFGNGEIFLENCIGAG